VNHSGASHMFFKTEQKYVPRGAFNNFNVQAKNNVKSNNFKQFTMWNGLSGRSKLPDKTKI